MSRVNLDHRYPAFLRLVGEESLELRETPTMESPLGVCLLLHSDTAANGSQVLNHNGTASRGVLDDAFGEDMIMISSLAQQFARELAQVAFRAPGAFCLKLATQAEDATFLFLPASLSQELLRGGDSRTIESQVNSHHFLRGSGSRFRDGEGDMEGEASLAVAQIGTTDLAANVLLCIGRDTKGQFNTPGNGRKATDHRVPLDPGGTLIIADRADVRGRDTRFPSLLLAIKGRFDGFCRLHAGRAHQLRGQVRILPTQIIVRLLMQFNAIAALADKAHTSNDIETGCMLLKRLLEYPRLLGRRFQVDGDRSIHTKSLSYGTSKCKHRKGKAWRCRFAGGVSSPCLNAGVSTPQFDERKEVKDVLAYLRLLVNPSDRASFERVVNVPPRKIGAKTLAQLKTWAELEERSLLSVAARANEYSGLSSAARQALCAFTRLIERLTKESATRPLSELIDLVLRESGYAAELQQGGPQEQERWDNLQELRRVAGTYDGLDPRAALEAFLEYIALVGGADLSMTAEDGVPLDPAGKDVVTLMTLHAAKGLEFPVVFIAGLDEGSLPHARSCDSREHLDEERRLFYVGATRAMQRLYLVRAQRRLLFGRVMASTPSRFLADLPPHLLHT